MIIFLKKSWTLVHLDQQMDIVSSAQFRKQQRDCMTVGVPAVTTNNYPSRNPHTTISAFLKKYYYPLLCKQKKCTTGLEVTFNCSVLTAHFISYKNKKHEQKKGIYLKDYFSLFHFKSLFPTLLFLSHHISCEVFTYQCKTCGCSIRQKTPLPFCA